MKKMMLAVIVAVVLCGPVFAQQADSTIIPGNFDAQSLSLTGGNHDLNHAGWLVYVSGALVCILGLSDFDDSLGKVTAIGGGAAALSGIVLVFATSPHATGTR
jgi:hypothetical protein